MKQAPAGVRVVYPPPPLSRPDAPLAKIIVPYAGRVHPDTRESLEPHRDRVQYIDVSSEGRYWDLFQSLWREAVDFVLIEHDIVVNKNTIAKLDKCPQSWCVHPYEWHWRPRYTWITDHSSKILNASLGCTRFRTELMRAVPQLGSRKALKVLENRSVRKHPIPYWVVDDIVNQGHLLGKFGWCQHEKVNHRAS